MAAGTNMWATRDEFQFLSNKTQGDFIVRTRVEWIGPGVDPHLYRASESDLTAMMEASANPTFMRPSEFRPDVPPGLDEWSVASCGSSSVALACACARRATHNSSVPLG